MKKPDGLELQKLFSTQELLIAALVHRSWAHEKGQKENNERLEFLGDSVLSLIMSEYLFTRFPLLPEGEMARMRSAIVNTMVLAETAKKLQLGHELYLGKGEERTGGREKESILADTFEAVVGAIYLDGGLQKAKKFILTSHADVIDRVCNQEDLRDAKTQLQEMVQQEDRTLPHYTVVEERGPDHNKWFVVQVFLDNHCIGEGDGPTKKQAQQNAASQALIKIRNRKRQSPHT